MHRAAAAWAEVAADVEQAADSEVEQVELAAETGLELGCHRFLHRPQGHHRRGCRLGPQTRDLRNDTQKYTYDTQYTHVTQKFIIYAKIIFRF